MGGVTSKQGAAQQYQMTLVETQDGHLKMKGPVLKQLASSLANAVGTQKPTDGSDGNTAFQNSSRALHILRTDFLDALHDLIGFYAAQPASFSREDAAANNPEFQKKSAALSAVTGLLTTTLRQSTRERPIIAFLNAEDYQAKSIEHLKSKYKIEQFEISEDDLKNANLSSLAASVKEKKCHAVFGTRTLTRLAAFYVNHSLGRTIPSVEGTRRAHSRLSQREKHDVHGSTSWYSPKKADGNVSLQDLKDAKHAPADQFPLMLKGSVVDSYEGRANSPDELVKLIDHIVAEGLEKRLEGKKTAIGNLLKAIYNPNDTASDSVKGQLRKWDEKSPYFVEKYWSKEKFVKLQVTGFISKGGDHVLYGLSEKIPSSDKTSTKSLGYVSPPQSIPRGHGNLETIATKVGQFLTGLFNHGVKKTVFRLNVWIPKGSGKFVAEDIHIGEFNARFCFTNHRLYKSAYAECEWLDRAIEAQALNQKPETSMWARFKSNQAGHVGLAVHFTAQDSSCVGMKWSQLLDIAAVDKLYDPNTRDYGKLRVRAEKGNSGELKYKSDEQITAWDVDGLGEPYLTFYYTAKDFQEAISFEREVRRHVTKHPQPQDEMFEEHSKLAKSIDALAVTRK